MDDLPIEGIARTKAEYETAIMVLLKRCNDLLLLELIFKILQKSNC